MIKKLRHILTYHDSEPTEVLQGLIWFIFAPMVLEAEFFPKFWYLAIISALVGFGTLYSVVYKSLETRRKFAYGYGIIAIIFVVIHFSLLNTFNWTPMNWGWVVIAISALSNIRRITQKIKSKNEDKIQNDISKMYREDLKEKIKQQQEENFNLRIENIKLQEKLKS
jgi:hypothetical protein